MTSVVSGTGRCLGRLVKSLGLREFLPAAAASPQFCLRNLSSEIGHTETGSQRPTLVQLKASPPAKNAGDAGLLESNSGSLGLGDMAQASAPGGTPLPAEGNEVAPRDSMNVQLPPVDPVAAVEGDVKPKGPLSAVPLAPILPPPPEYEGESMVMREIRLHNSSMWGLKGQIISGEIITVGKEYVVVDFGFKSLSRFFKKELSTSQIYATTEDHKIKRKEGVFFVGDRLQFRIDEVESPYGDMSLTTHKLHDSIQKDLVWKELVEAYESNTHIQGRVLNPVDRGYAVGVGGFVCFCPINYIHPGSSQKIGVLQPFKIMKMSGPGERRSIIVMGAGSDRRRNMIRPRMNNFGAGNTWVGGG